MKDDEKILKALASDEISTQMLEPGEREALERFDRELNRLGEERGIPLEKRDRLGEEVFGLVPGSREALNKQTRITGIIFKAGRDE